MPGRDKSEAHMAEQMEKLRQKIAGLEEMEHKDRPVEEILEYQLAVEKLIATIATTCINFEPANIEASLNQALQALGEFTGVDRAYFILFSKSEAQVDHVYEWCAAGLEPGLAHLEGNSIDATLPLLEKLAALDDGGVSAKADLPSEESANNKTWPAAGDRPVIKVPIIDETGLTVAIIGLVSAQIEKVWTSNEATLLQRVGEILIKVLGRRQRAEERQSSEELFRQILASIADHVYVTEVTENGDRINLHLSHHAEDLTDYPTEKLLADWTLWPQTIIHPDDRATAAAQAARLARGEDSEAEYRLVRADGTVLWVRDRARVKSKGTSKIVYGLVSDITRRKLVELEREWLTNELRDIKETLEERVWARTAELQAIIDAVGEGIVVTDLNGVIQYINPALERLTGYSEAEALGQTPALWKSNKHDNAFYVQMWQTILNGQTWRGEVVNKRKNGGLYEAVLTISPILGPEGQSFGFVGVQHDITPFREMDRLKSEFISTAAHELRTPLTSIRGFSEILCTRQLSEERKTRYLTYINQQAEALAAIIDDLLDLSRLEAGEGFEIAEQLVNVKEIVEEIVFGFQENYPDHDYRIVGLETWPAIKGDPAKLAQLFKNLFSNATKYSPNSGEIVFEAAVQDQYGLLHLKLSDQGIGMTPEQLAHIFDRFYRADASNTAAGGTGLGMTISRLIVERHGGKIWVESEKGAGTTVHMLLPLPDRPPHILVIEDDKMLQDIQQRHLELQGFAVFTAGEGKTGLELAQTCFPNLILLDLALPGMTGFTILEELQASELTNNIPVIITSAMERPEEVERTLSNVVIDYLVKPYTMNDLTVRVNRGLALARREAGRKWYS